MTDKAKRHKGITAFLVPTDTQGFTRGKPDEKLGIRASGSCTVFFEDCAIPARYRLGEEGEGFKIAMTTLDGGRIGIAAQALGIARAAFEEARRVREGAQDLRPADRELQAIQFMLADMATELDAARLLVWRAASLKDKGVRAQRRRARWPSSTRPRWRRGSPTKAIQIHGGYGYMTEYDVERHYRDARITEIYEGTSEIQRLVISSSVLKD